MASVDYFLKIAGIQGESQDAKHKDEIDVMSWSWGATNAGTMAHGGGGGAGKVSMQDFHFTMRVNKATPKLALAMSNGTHIPECLLTLRKAGKDQQEFLKIKFSDVLISSYLTSGSGGEMEGSESCSFNYSKIEYEYRPQKKDGTLDGPVTFNWSVKTNTGA
ncbi:MAG: Hcp family type VI secretion system effector [Pyrinomonadaceae bacterium]